MSQSQSISVSSLKPGERAVVEQYASNAGREYKLKLLALGLTKGTEFTVVKASPFGDPVEIELRGYRLSLRRHEAEVVLCSQ
ncbi:MAG: ferrous iron transport protein A [Fibromonadales bacterium]|nr:ferrous iron transport protein A [Fibromonadales bacterium]